MVTDQKRGEGDAFRTLRRLKRAWQVLEQFWTVGPHTPSKVLNLTLFKININRFTSNFCGFIGVKMREGSKSAGKNGKIVCVVRWERGGGMSTKRKMVKIILTHNRIP